MSSGFHNPIGISFYQTEVPGSLNIVGSGYEACSPNKPPEFIPVDHASLHYCLEGEGYFQVQDRVQHIYPGDIFYIPPQTANHYYPDPDNPWCYRWVDIGGSAVEQVLLTCGLTPESFCIHAVPLPELEHCFERIYYACITKQEFRALAELYQLLDNVRQVYDHVSPPAASHSEVLFQELLLYIHQHYREDISVATMAEERCLDRTYIFKLFKKYKNTSPSEYLLNYRLRKACVLLAKTSLSMNEISMAVGFHSASYFSRQFTARKKMTPSEYRKQNF